MCDIVIKSNIPKSNIPKYVYKVLQKVGNGKYVTPVMGEPLYKGTWKKAKSYPDPHLINLIDALKTKYPTRRFAGSSQWSSNHTGRWGSFKFKKDALSSNLINNFVSETGVRYPKVIGKCEIKGDVSESKYAHHPTYLSTHLRVVEEV
jgi:hypothetical protein